MAKTSVDKIDFVNRNFNTALTRTTILLVILSTQLLQLWEQLAKLLKFSSSDKSASKKQTPVGKKQTSKKGASSASSSDGEVNNDEPPSDVSAPPSPKTKVKSN